MNSNNPPLQQSVEYAIPYALRYSGMLNSLFSGLTFTLGIACVSTESPSFYAWCSLTFVMLIWNSEIQPYRTSLRALREAKHPLLKTIPVIKRSVPFLAGWIFLSLVALGALNKNGWIGF